MKGSPGTKYFFIKPNTLSQSHTLSISHSLTLDMLNKFCFHLYAQNSLFIAENHTVRATIYLDTLASFFRNLANDCQKSKYLLPCFQVKINNSG